MASKEYYSDQIISAIDTVISGRLRDLKYDVTIECLVTNNDKRDDGIYRVKTENAEFEAYAKDGDSYYVNDTVFVKIPQGDYSLQKFITGRKVDADVAADAYNLKLPFDDFIGLQQIPNDNKKQSTEYEFLANCPDESGWWQSTDENDEPLHWKNLYTWSKAITLEDGTEAERDGYIGDQLGVEVDIQTTLGGYKPRSGDYGLKITLSGKVPVEGSEPQDYTVEGYLRLSDMYGNPYSFYEPYHQQKAFDISEFLVLTNISIDFWQDYSFISETGTVIPYAYVGEKAVPDAAEDDSIEYLLPNIILSGLNVYAGLATDEVDEEKTFLFTYDSLGYGVDGESNERLLQFNWVHKDEDGEFVLINTNDKLEEAGGAVHWYRYESGYLSDAAQDFGGYNWKEITADDGLDKTNVFELKQVMDVAKGTERFKVIVAFDDTYVTSDILEFSNVIDIESVNESLAASDEVIFKTFVEKTVIYDVNDPTKLYDSEYETIATTTWVDDVPQVTYELVKSNKRKTEKRLVEDSSIGNFFVYDETGKCLQDSTQTYYSSKTYYVQPWIKVDDKSYAPLPESDAIEWIFPSSYSLIRSFSPVTKGMDYYTSFAGQITAYQFSISPQYDESYHNNTIRAIVTHNGRQYHLSKELAFGNARSQGSDYTIVLSQAEPENNAYLISGEDFEIVANVYDMDGQLADGKFVYFWDVIGPSVGTTDYSGEGGYIKTSTEWDGSTNSFNTNTYKGKIYGDLPPIFKVTVTGAASYSISAIRGFALASNKTTAEIYDINAPGRIEYKSSGTVPVWDSNYFSVYGEDNEEVYPTWDLTELQLTTAVDGESKVTSSWEEKSDDEKLLTLSKRAGSTSTFGANIDNDTGTANLTTGDKYKLAITNNHNSQWYWVDGMDEANYIYLTADFGNGTIKQPIAIGYNNYSSSLINSWDGTLSADKQNNSILAKMLAAGTLDSKKRFTGIMLGDWNDNADSSINGTSLERNAGLWGLQNNQQTFGLRTDGTGFIGAASNGQITFDGNNALISDSSKDFYINLNPTRYDYTADGGLSYTKKSYSPYFLYAKTKKTSSTSSDDVGTKTIWTKSFLDDENNDYFIVDPNNGVLTSGGIIARYGKIGNWEISNQGLQQKSDDAYMSLGYSFTSKKYLQKTEYQDLYTEKELTTIEDLENYATEKKQELEKLNSELTAWNQEKATTDEEEWENTYAEKSAAIASAQAELNTAEKALKEEKEELNKCYAIFAGENQYSTPLFSVDWNGTMSARRGVIGNTWTIDDNGLTQKNNNGIIYIGNSKEEKDLLLDNGNSISTKSISIYNKNEAGDPYSILAGYQATNSGDPVVNFGVTQKGYLFSQAGRIGGWDIGATTLSATQKKTNGDTETVAASIVLDSANSRLYAGQYFIDDNGNTIYPITIDGESGLIQIVNRPSGSDYDYAALNLAGYTLKAMTDQTATYSSMNNVPIATNSGNTKKEVYAANTTDSADTLDNTTLDLSSLGTVDNTLSMDAQIENAEAVIAATSSDIEGAMGLKFLKRIGDINNGDHFGVNITASTLSSVNETDENGSTTTIVPKALVVQPENMNSIYDVAALGTDTNRWNIYADQMSVRDLRVDGVLWAPTYMVGRKNSKNEVIGYDEVASQFWVRQLLNSVIDSLNSTSGSAHSANVGVRKLNGHTHVIDMTVDSTSGTVTAKLGAINFLKAGEEAPVYSLSAAEIAKTTWFKKQAYGTCVVVAGYQSTTSIIIRNQLSNRNNTLETRKLELSINDNKATVTCTNGSHTFTIMQVSIST